MRSLGVDVDLNGHPKKPEVLPDISLRNAEQTVQSLVFMGIEHNIRVMHQMGQNASLAISSRRRAARRIGRVSAHT